ncbi:MAG TPA: C45 family peptidase [Chloroflexota bacterium]|nr:C45 family peptidase [Chloroflexota bacterium]
MDRHIPVIVSEGGPYQRGCHLGIHATNRVAHAVDAYMSLFHTRVGLPREDVRAHAARFIPLIERLTPSLYQEMRGIASGSGQDLHDIVAINARTELLYGLGARAECTAIGAVSPASADAHVRIGQNWDWHPSLAGSLVLWVLRRDQETDVITLTEAGMVGKIGVNAAGLALCVNLLQSDSDHQEPALPMHLILRHVLDTARSVDQAVRLLAGIERATSCNHLLADQRGGLASVEATPGGQAVLRAPDGVLVHTNHCLDATLFAGDRGVRSYDETLARHGRASGLAHDLLPLDEQAFRQILADHATAPEAICRHVQVDLPDEEQAESVASILVDLTAGTLDLADGPPCDYPYRRLALGEYLRRPPVRDVPAAHRPRSPVPSDAGVQA